MTATEESNGEIYVLQKQHDDQLLALNKVMETHFTQLTERITYLAEKLDRMESGSTASNRYPTGQATLNGISIIEPQQSKNCLFGQSNNK